MRQPYLGKAEPDDEEGPTRTDTQRIGGHGHNQEVSAPTHIIQRMINQPFLNEAIYVQTLIDLGLSVPMLIS